MGRLSHTVSGDIASFRTPSRVPIESLKFHFLPKQADGMPSPENPIPIEGWTGLNGYGAGENLLPFDSVMSDGYTRTLDGLTATYNNGVVRITGNHTKSGWTNIIDFYSVWQNKNVTLPPGTYNMANNLYVVCKIDDAGSYVNKSGEFTVNESAIIQGFYVPVYGEGEKDITVPLVLSLGTTRPKKYEPYYPIKTIPIIFPSNGKNIVDWVTPDGFSVAVSLFNGWNADWIRGPIYVDRSNFGKRIIYSAIIDNTNGIRDAALHVLVKDKNEAYVSSGITSEIVPIGSSKRVYAVVPITGASWYKIYLGLTIGSGCIVSNPMAEYSMSMTSYEPYSSDTTFYGGYIDPVAGEIVAEWGKKYLTGNEGWFTYGSLESSEGISFACPMMDKKLGYKTSKCSMFDNVDGAWGSGHKSEFGIYSDHRTVENIYVRRPNEGILTLNDFKQWLSENSPEIIYELKTPIHVPVAPQDLQAFLDHNNFWSDANDITEVTYAVTESKDILATRKKAMEFDIGHRKKVRWNQLARDISTSHWRIHLSNALRGTISDGIAECYYVTNKQYQRYSASVTTINSISWDADHYYYASYMVKPTYDGKFGIEFARGKQIQGMANVNANEWKRACTKQKPKSTGFSGLYIPFPDPVGPIDEGYQVKAPFVVDLTLMFGAGNEPATQTEFERICELNGIDLTTYQPYDEGSDRWLIIP